MTAPADIAALFADLGIRQGENMKAIPVTKLLDYMNKAEELNNGSGAACWMGLRMALEMILAETAPQIDHIESIQGPEGCEPIPVVYVR